MAPCAQTNESASINTATDDAPRMIRRCPVCRGRRLHYAFSKSVHRIIRCEGCGLMMLNPQPTDSELAQIYHANYFLGGNDTASSQSVTAMKAATARQYLQSVSRYRGGHGQTLLEVGCGRGELLDEARRLGYTVTGVELSPDAADAARARLNGDGTVVCGSLELAGLPDCAFDVCMLCDVIEHVRDPIGLLAIVRRLLRPGGTLFIATPSLDSWSARMLKGNWMEFKPEHLFYFDAATMQTALFRAGFHEAIVGAGWKILNIDYIAEHFTRFPVPMVGRIVRIAAKLTPSALRARNLSVVASGMNVMCTPAPRAERRTLSVIVPAFNEAATFDALMQRLLRKSITGLSIEIIVVESNSTDGTRELAERYANHARVRVIFEDRPRGKGHAVRQGLAAARGDFILIQDADLEYDMEDYDTLLEPLVSGREAFILGSRHGANAWWKMRQFAGQHLLSLFFNCGHRFFTFLVNALFAQKLKDPFTMFKVFRRDCLFGLEFSCDRFDFDYELLVKLVRKGYRPVEIPVNYRSRSYQEGKKVSILRDPLNWIRALAWLRCTRVDPLGVVEQQRQRDRLAPAQAQGIASKAA